MSTKDSGQVDSSKEGQSQLASHQKRNIVRTVAIVIVFISSLLAVFVYRVNLPIVLSDDELKKRGVFLFEKVRSFKEFSLLDFRGEAFTSDELKGKWSLVFFGFTYCPDVCPTTMALLNRFYSQQLEGDFGEDLQIVMVSVDPARDTPEKLFSYVSFFNPNFVGVTGEFLELHRFATQLNIPFTKVPGGGDDYQVEHSGNIVIINPQGHYVGFFRAPHELSKLDLAYKSIRSSRR
jgi:protein SCO1/2